MPRDWDAAAYDRLSEPQLRWGRAVVARLDLAGNETVLDAGCGTGRVTQTLRDLLPSGRVVALDGSPAMLERAQERLGRERMAYVAADLMEPLPLRECVDALVSTATFHWIPDHDRLFLNLARVLRPGGQLEAQCGGAGNVAELTAVVRTLGHDIDWGKVYAGPEETGARLRSAGFTDARCWLTVEPTPIPPGDFEAFLATVCLGGILREVPEGDRDGFVRAVAALIPDTRLNYVRLNISARRR